MIQVFMISTITIFIYMVILYLVAQSIHNNSIIDIGWGMGFVIVTLVLIFVSEKIQLSKLIMSFMILIWGMRLSFYIYLRNLGKPEDFRYANWRKEWGKNQPLIAFFKIFMLQGIIMWIIALPVIMVFSGDALNPDIFGVAAIFIFLFGLVFEGKADAQIKRFKSNPDNKGKIITTGLWKYSRHPNYFGEAVLWWGLGIYAFSVCGSWYSLISPAIISVLLRFVSGVPLLEKKYKNNSDFLIYSAKTPVFIPFFGKKTIK